MQAYTHRMPTLFITKNDYYLGNKVFVYINFVIAINTNFICTFNLDTLQ